MEEMMKKTVVIQPDGRNLLEILTGQFYELPSFCAGRGTCGKCKVQVKKKDSDKEEVLACQYIPLECCEVEFLQEDREFCIETKVGKEILKEQSLTERKQIVVDIGTTTLAMLLLDEHGKVISSWTGLNPQRKYGADVISRIERANRGQKEELTTCIRETIFIGIRALCEEETISRVVFAGNTTMQHLFAGYSVEGLGSYPFSITQKDLVTGKLAEFYPELPEGLKDTEYVSMPCISAFVGGDIVAGILEAEWQQNLSDRKMEKQKSWLLLDIGTNGEMVLYLDGVYYTASTAAGPVFEGGTICCGIVSVMGAIDHVWEENGEMEYSTIGGELPIGICGTGLIESIATLRKMGILNREGLLIGYSECGYLIAREENGNLIRITQEDVRQFQLAKAAIRCGIEILCKVAKTSVQKLDRIYLAGGFGTKLDVKKSCEVGLLPSVSQSRYKVLGNAALSGCSIYCREEKAKACLKKIQDSSKEVVLALEEEFQKQYLEYLYF